MKIKVEGLDQKHAQKFQRKSTAIITISDAPELWDIRVVAKDIKSSDKGLLITLESHRVIYLPHDLYHTITIF